jgi:hypothetical protein
VSIVAHRDGRLSWRVQRPLWMSDQSLGSQGAELLGHALDSAKAKGEAFLWTDELRGDSIGWTMRLDPATTDADGAVIPPTLRAGFPVFTHA